MGGGSKPRNSSVGSQVKAGAEERGVTLRRKGGGWVALRSFLYLQGCVYACVRAHTGGVHQHVVLRRCSC